MVNIRDFNTKAIILKKYKVAENDLSFLMLTEKFGKINIWMKGARKIFQKQKFGTYLDLFSLLEIGLYKYKSRSTENERNLLKNIKTLEYNYDIRLNFEKFELANFFLQTVNKMTILNTGKEVFALLNESLVLLDKCDANNLDYLKYIFLLNLSTTLGYKFELDKCTNCGLLVPDQIKRIVFSFGDGGILCNVCKQKRLKDNTYYHDFFQINKDLFFLLKKFYKLDVFDNNFFKYFNDKDKSVMNTEAFNIFFDKVMKNLINLS
ncbi:MAG: DNA repair protein RecO [Elusimicrobiota bacterium]|jgi:DNA repair protein RecO (recombination protein O)|nr:DNA repair protein RecO [Elusimicrobiota bacterium]